MSAFLDYLKKRRKTLGVGADELAPLLGVRRAMVYKFLSGQSPISPERIGVLRSLLCKTPDDLTQFDALYAASGLAGTGHTGADSALPFSNLKISTLPYLPFAGSEESFAFMEKFIGKCMNLAVIQIQKVEIGPPERFDMQARMDAIEEKKVDVLYNLASLSRMKSLRFIPTPIRVTINGVMLQSQALALDSEKKPRIRAARTLLISGKQPDSDPFVVMTVRQEVGHVFMEQSHGLREIPGDIKNETLKEACLRTFDTLAPSELALTLSNLNLIRPTMLVCDEHTALGVVRALGGNGVLVLSPNSDQAIIHSVRRRSTPAYNFAIGMRRANNWDLFDFLGETIRTFLSTETETISELYEKLYFELVAYVKSCLSQTGIYVGGIRRTTDRITDPPPPDPIEAAMWVSERVTLVDQNARAVARRCLNLSRRSIENLSPELRPWEPILRRARERVQIAEAVDRDRIRNIIFSCAKMALGKDPLKVDTRPIALLKQIAPATLHGPLGELKHLAARENSHWLDFLYLLERELDTDLRDLRSWDEKLFEKSYALGLLITGIQNLLESSPDSQIVIAIRQFEPGARPQLESMCAAFADQKQMPELKEHLLEEMVGLTVYIAYLLGEPVGFIACRREKFDETAVPEWKSPNPLESGTEVLMVHYLYVAERMQKADVSYRLIRRVVEEGNIKIIEDGLEKATRGILLRTEQWQPPTALEPFEKSGFKELAGNAYVGFELKHI